MTRRFAGILAQALIAATLFTVGCDRIDEKADAPQIKPARKVQASRRQQKRAPTIASAKPEDIIAAIRNIASIIYVDSEASHTYAKTQELIKKTVEGKDFPKDEFAYFYRSKEYTDLIALNQERKELRKTIPAEWLDLQTFDLFFELEERLSKDCRSTSKRQPKPVGIPEDYTYASVPDRDVAAQNLVTHFCLRGDAGYTFLIPVHGKSSVEKMVAQVKQSRLFQGKNSKAIIAAFSSKRYFDYLEKLADVDARRQNLKLAMGEPSRELHLAMEQLMKLAWAQPACQELEQANHGPYSR